MMCASRHRLAILAAVLVGLLLACRGDERGAGPPPAPDGAGDGKQIFYGQRSSAHKSLDPMMQFDSASSDLIVNLYDTLLEYHYLARPYELVPSLLAGMPERQEDGVTYAFTLRSGVRFSPDPAFPGGTGRELVSDDVIYSLKRFADINVNTRSYILIAGYVDGLDEFREQSRAAGAGFDRDAVDIAGVQRIDDYRFTIRFTEDNPLAFFPLAHPCLSILPREAVEMYGDEFERHPVGTGAFRVKQFSRRGVIILERNPDYHLTYPDLGAPGDRERGLLVDAGKPLPLYDELHLPLIEESQPAMLKFRKGEIDWMSLGRDDFSQMAYRDSDGSFHLKGDYAQKFDMYTEPGLSVEYIVFNQRDELVSNKALRQAIAWSIDTPAFLELLLNGRGLPLETVVPHPIAGSQNDIDVEYYTQDLGKARAKLAEAGYPGGDGLPELTIEYRAATKTTRQSFEFLRNELAAVGIKIRANFQTFSAFLRRVESGNYQMTAAGWLADFPDGENFYQLLYSGNHVPGTNSSYFDHPEFDRLYLASRFMRNGKERFELFRQMSEIVKDEVPILLRFNQMRMGLTQKRVGNMKRNIMLGQHYKYLSVDRAPGAS